MNIITYEQLVDLKTQLNAWCNERHLSLEGQQKGLIGNLLEEILEVIRANDIKDKVGEYCDIIVFSMNAFGEENTESVINGILEADRTHKEAFEQGDAIIGCIGVLSNQNFEATKRTILVPSRVEKKFTAPLISFVIYYALESIKALGYDPYKCMLETIKKINSRTGKYDASIGKWIKDTSPAAVAKYYVPNYEAYKL